MKKIYFTPQTTLAVMTFRPLMYTTSIDNGGPGDDDDVDSKKRFFADADDFDEASDDECRTFYRSYAK